MIDPAAGSPSAPPSSPTDSSAGDRRIQAINDSLIQFQETWVAQLQTEIQALQQEKYHLQSEVQHLRQTQTQLLRQGLQTSAPAPSPSPAAAVSPQILQQQQQWAKQFAQILAEHLQQQLVALVASHGSSIDATLSPADLHRRSEDIQHLLAGLDRSLTSTLHTLQQEINQSQQALKDQLTAMQGLERQGEAILETLVQRLSQQLAQHSSTLPTAVSPASARSTPSPVVSPPPPSPPTSADSIAPTSAPAAPTPASSPEDYTLDLDKLPPPPAPRPTPPTRRTASAPRWNWGGVLLALASVLGLALQYVLVERLFQVTPSGNGWGSAGEPLAATWGNTWLAVWLRMVVVLPVVIGLSQYFYPSLWADLQALRQGTLPGLSPLEHRRLGVNLLLGGSLLFVSQWSLYQAVGQAAAGAAVTLFFLYPALLALLSWGLVGDRPSSFRLYCLIALGVGGIATLSVSQDVPEWGLEALLLALLSAGGFAFYLLLTSVVGRRLHYSVITVVQFGLVFVLATPAMFVVPQLTPAQIQTLVQGGLWLGGAAAVSYAFNTFSVEAIGALPTTLITALAPFLTVLLASLLLQDGIPWSLGFGTLAVTLGSTFMNLESLKRAR
ncbi:MAG: hypothetical protein ACO4CG_14105 [Prochlorothrix sp.]